MAKLQFGDLVLEVEVATDEQFGSRVNFSVNGANISHDYFASLVQFVEIQRDIQRKGCGSINDDVK